MNATSETQGSTVIAVPGLFWRDHADRAPVCEGEVLATPVGHRGSCVLLREDDPGIPVLLSDAEFYADPGSMDECPRSIRDSAKRTVTALGRLRASANELGRSNGRPHGHD